MSSNPHSQWSNEKISESLKSPFQKLGNLFVEMTSSFVEDDTEAQLQATNDNLDLSSSHSLMVEASGSPRARLYRVKL